MFDIFSKHFYDNFAISIYMGYSIDINEYWKDFKEAHFALEFHMEVKILKEIKIKNLEKLKELTYKNKDNLYEGFMTEDYVLNNIEVLFNIMMDSNYVLRWFFL